MAWRFYGRTQEVADLKRILNRDSWVFLKIEGRRRIGKTSLIQQALPEKYANKSIYLQIPDSSPVGVVSRFSEALETHGVIVQAPKNLREMARTIEQLLLDGYAVVLDEFQYFKRKQLFEFNSFLQESIDNIITRPKLRPGPLVVLGSLHTEMTALLDDRSAPLFGRATDTMSVDHLSPASVSEILSDQDCLSPQHLLFLWNLFEGVPKFYRDAFEQGVLSASPFKILEVLFFASAAPLRSEAENWFLSELRGQYDVILNTLARQAMCNHGELMSTIKDQYGGETEKQIGSYLKTLVEKYNLVEKKHPIFSKPNSRNARYRIKDLFLTSWLSSLRAQVEASEFRPQQPLIERALQRLQDSEGFAFEELMRKTIRERSRQGRGDFAISREVEGYWNKAEIEIDIVCINDDDKIVHHFSCKRNSAKAVKDLDRLKGHAARFLASTEATQLRGYKQSYVLAAPEFTAEERRMRFESDTRLIDLRDLELIPRFSSKP